VLWSYGRVAWHHLPYLQYSNEASNISQSIKIVNWGLEPISLQRPTLPVYLLAAVDWVVHGVGTAMGWYGPEQLLPSPRFWDLGLSVADHGSDVVVVANRLVCAVMAAGSICMIFWLGRALFFSERLALMAALFAAISGVMTRCAMIVRPEIFMCFFVALALVGAARIFSHGRRSDYLWAGLFAGLACSSKYNAGLVVVPLVIAHFVRTNKADRRHRWLLLAGIACVLGFLLGTPYAAIDHPRFISDLRFEFAHYRAGHLGRDGGDIWTYLWVIWKMERWVGLLALAGLIRGVMTRSRVVLMLAAFAVPYLIAISILPVRMARHLTPILPVIAVIAAYEAEAWLSWALRWSRGWKLWLWRTCVLALLGWVTFIGVNQSRIMIDIHTGENGRDEARAWIDQNLPDGAVIAIESRTPWIDTDRFHVRRIPVSYSTSALWAHPPEWYASQGFDYLVLSSRVQGLYRQDLTRNSGELEAYLQLNRANEVAGIFYGRRWNIAVLKVPDSMKPKVDPGPPPWFVWAGVKDPRPVWSEGEWPVVVWSGGRAPKTNSLVGLSKMGPWIQEWIDIGRERGLLVPYAQYMESRAE